MKLNVIKHPLFFSTTGIICGLISLVLNFLTNSNLDRTSLILSILIIFTGAIAFCISYHRFVKNK